MRRCIGMTGQRFTVAQIIGNINQRQFVQNAIGSSFTVVDLKRDNAAKTGHLFARKIMLRVIGQPGITHIFYRLMRRQHVGAGQCADCHDTGLAHYAP